MSRSRLSRPLSFAGAVLAALLVSACGSGNNIPTEKVIYTSSADCADGGKLDFDKCSKAIDKAITEHEKSAAKFITLSDCEKSEGNDRCEKAAERHYRPRLMGFLFTINKNIVAAPLYAGLKGAPVFRGSDGTVFDQERTADVKFSKEAALKSVGFIPDKKRAGRG